MPEIPIIRPPSEWRSLLVRVTRGCKWTRCRFCGIYPHLGEPGFSIRSVAEIKRDIDLLKLHHPNAETAFLGDADPLQAGVDAFVEIAEYLRKVFPIKRLTCYARVSTLWKLRKDAIQILARAGLNRVHIGLESGLFPADRFFMALQARIGASRALRHIMDARHRAKGDFSGRWCPEHECCLSVTKVHAISLSAVSGAVSGDRRRGRDRALSELF